MQTTKTATRRFAITITVLTVAAIWLDLGARRTGAIQDSEDFPSPIGIARGQTLRLTAVNIGERAIVGPQYRLLDSLGQTLAETPEPHLIPPGQFRSFDFDLPDPPPGTLDHFGRVQVRAVIGNRTPKDLRVSFEVFDNETGKTTVFFGHDFTKSVNPQAGRAGS